MAGLPAPLVNMLRERIADPVRRHHGGDSTHVGVTSDAETVQRFMAEGFGPNDGTTPDPFALIRRQMEAWGQQMPEMHLSMDTRGNRHASTDNPDYPLAAPATAEDLARLERRIGRRVPQDLADMYGIADGGWGPGYAFTRGHGPGLLSVAGALAELDNLERSGAGYTGDVDWPAHYLPLTDLVGTTAYDLDTGRIVQWDDHWYDHDKTVEQAFAVSHPSLQDFLQEWLLG